MFFFHEEYNANVEESLEALLLPWALFAFTPYILWANPELRREPTAWEITLGQGNNGHWRQ